MANSQGKPRSSAGDGDVSGCVSNLIQAFMNSLDVFKRLRERRRKRKSRKQESPDQPGHPSRDELQLSNSLRRGPQDIQDCYERHYSKAGERFAKGDAVAHSSLAETVLKLNTGLVGIIAAFLNHDSKSKNIDLDYKSLTNLSNSSRAEAVDSLNQLYRRLSLSQLQVYQIGQCQRCGKPTGTQKHDCSESGNIKSRSGKRTHTGPRSRHNGPTVARIPLKSSSQPQLVVVRPRTHRKTSSSSSTSTKSHSTALSSPLTSPLGHPPPQYTAKEPYQDHCKAAPKSRPAAAARGRTNSVDGQRPTTWPHTKPDLAGPVPLQSALPQASSPRRDPQPPENQTSPQTQQLPIRRRTEKTILSTYTFASDSTKLGEIPQKNWTTPFDYAEAERLNAEVYANGYPNVGLVESNRPQKQKKGLFGFLRRGSGVGV